MKNRKKKKITELKWISVKDKLPIDLWKEQFPSDNNYQNILENCLAVFEDRDEDTGKVWDEEVVPVSYNGKIGWTYYIKPSEPHQSVDRLTKWMPFPEP